LYGDQLKKFPNLAESMFLDRAAQFSVRLKWDVTLDENGWERDVYDRHNPLYLIWQNDDHSHGGSMRFLPTTGPTMAADHFSDLSDGVAITSPLIWEVTRFCLAPECDNALVSARLMLAAAELGHKFHLRHAVGVFDRRMSAIYKRLGWGPEIVGTRGHGRNAICLGLWDFGAAPIDSLRKRTGIGAATCRNWLNQSFNVPLQGQRIA